jgi:hypothetical protein
MPSASRRLPHTTTFHGDDSSFIALPESQDPPLPLPFARAIMTLCGTNRNADMLDVRLSIGSAGVLAETVELLALELLVGAVE